MKEYKEAKFTIFVLLFIEDLFLLLQRIVNLVIWLYK